jgi:hypothetical protein
MKILVKENLIKKSMFHRTAEELREFAKENNIKLLNLLEYLRRRNYKKIQKETVLKDVKNNS